jgi:CheY-like chemotaxis protein
VTTGPILIVEDDPADAERLVTGLEKRGWLVETVADGLTALGRLRLEPKPRALVLDLSVPTVDGYAVFDELSNNKTFGRLPVVIVTSATEVDGALLEGVAKVLTKPRTSDGWEPLLDALHAALAGVRG